VPARPKACRRVDGFFEDGFWSLGGDFFNFHAAGLGGHEDQSAGGTVKDDSEIELAVDGGRFFNEEALHLLALRAGLVGDELHAEDVLDVQVGVFAVAGDFDAAAFAAASGVNLRLDDDARGALGKQFAGYSRGFFRRVGHFAPGHGNAVFCQDFLCLILVNFHVL